jgi:hypothetical protein
MTASRTQKAQSLNILRGNMEAISISGLASEHQARIREIGLWAWMDEQAAIKAPTVTVGPKLESITRHKRVCTVCGVTFYSKRSDAKLCSNRCRLRSSRSPSH